jgi:hypothetical protein
MLLTTEIIKEIQFIFGHWGGGVQIKNEMHSIDMRYVHSIMTTKLITHAEADIILAKMKAYLDAGDETGCLRKQLKRTKWVTNGYGSEASTPGPAPAAPRVCSICQFPGHNSRTCPCDFWTD